MTFYYYMKGKVNPQVAYLFKKKKKSYDHGFKCNHIK